MEVGK